MYEITSGVVSSAQKVVIYGPEGIGKSTFAAQFPDPVFIDTEGSTKKLNIRRFPKPTSWEMLKNEVKEAMNGRLCKTLVIDTFDWAEQLCIETICSAHQKKGIEDFGYGNGYVYEKEEIGKFLNLLQEVVDSGINVVLTAHAQMRKFEQPDELGAYDRWELKLGKKTSSQISPLVKEWADMVLFANYKTYAVAVDKDGKAHQVTHGSYIPLVQSDDRVLRKSAFESMYGTFDKFRNTCAATLSAQIKAVNFYAKARKYESSLEAALDGTEVPVSVYKNLIEAVHDNMHYMYDYVALRKKLLGVDELHFYDLYTPVVPDADMKITFEEAKETVLKALAPMGEDYRGQNKRSIFRRCKSSPLCAAQS